MQNKPEPLLLTYNSHNHHQSSKSHPQCPERITVLVQHMKQLQEKWAANSVNMQAVTDDQVEGIEQLLIQTHGANYHEFVKEMWQPETPKSELFINRDTYFMKHTYACAKEAATATIVALKGVIEQKFGSGMALVRPPGHHSGMKGQPHGFSFFNNIGVGVNYALKQGYKKVAIVDWDVHHGEGTQTLFESRSDVLYISLHRYDHGKFFPHVGELSSSRFVGKGPGEGYSVNICWNLPEKGKNQLYKTEETCSDKEYAYAFNQLVLPILKQYDPQLIFVSCGFDAAEGDPIGKCRVTDQGYRWMTNQLCKLKKPMVLALEGGYSLGPLKWACEAVVGVLSKQVKVEETQWGEANEIGLEGVKWCKSIQSDYWKL